MSKSNIGRSPRLKLSATIGASTPELSAVYAAGESTTGATGKASRPPTADDTTAPKRSSSRRSSALKQDVRQDPNGVAQAPRHSWFSRKGTWPRTSQNAVPTAKVAPENAWGEGSNKPDTSLDSEVPLAHVATTQQISDKQVARPKHLPYAHANASTQSLPVIRRSSRSPPRNTKTRLSAELINNARDNEPENTSVPQDTPVAQPVDHPSENDISDTLPQAPVHGDAAAEAARGSWLAWWYGQGGDLQPTAESDNKTPVIAVETIKAPVEPEAMQESTATESASDLQPPPTDAERPPESSTTDGVPGNRPRSWFSLWGGAYANPASTETAKPETTNDTPEDHSPSLQTEVTPEPEPIVEPSKDPINPAPATEPASVSYGSLLYGWATWSKEQPGSSGIQASTEVAPGVSLVASDPGKADAPLDTALIAPQESGGLSRSGSAKVSRVIDSKPVGSKTAASFVKSAAANKPNDSSLTVPAQHSKATDTPSLATEAGTLRTSSKVSSSDASAAQRKLQKILPQNHVLPPFEHCYQCPETPTILQQLSSIFRQPPKHEGHLHLERKTPKIKKAVAIGVHGFFPMRLVRTVLGEPTGTSVRFANHAANSIQKWADHNGVEVEIEKIALEGEGKVGDRVEMLWKLLQNWMDHVRSADFVFMAAHSQGVVVGVQLLARLIEEGCVENARIGFTGMAGINLGPFGHLPTTLLTGSARELFEFQKQNSAVHKKYMQALRTVLAQNVRILYVGSIDDQLVPLESSTIVNISHPYIYRAVFVDGRAHAPDFLSHLVGFAMKLRNLGISDHGLIRELSSPLAGSLYGGEGHSRIYDDGAVYDLGVRHALETADCPDVPLRVQPFELPTSVNPYFLPWSMRGLLEEPYVRDQLWPECMQLLEQFDNWHPTNKSLKDVKFRLEGIKSKL